MMIQDEKNIIEMLERLKENPDYNIKYDKKNFKEFFLKYYGTTGLLASPWMSQNNADESRIALDNWITQMIDAGNPFINKDKSPDYKAGLMSAVLCLVILVITAFIVGLSFKMVFPMFLLVPIIGISVAVCFKKSSPFTKNMPIFRDTVDLLESNPDPSRFLPGNIRNVWKKWISEGTGNPYLELHQSSTHHSK